MQYLLTSLATALLVEPAVVRAGVGLVLEAMASGARPADWAALRERVPAALPLLEPTQRCRGAGGQIVGPPPQGPSGVHEALQELGLGSWRATLLLGLTLRHLEERAGEDLLRSILDRVPSLDGVDDEVEIAETATETVLPPLDISVVGDDIPDWLRAGLTP
ncbi:MAG: hypothetical protein CMJ83_19660 [Planctomycetes bacterium]|nr:hypothetical protein [Planctomycetota bacterium]